MGATNSTLNYQLSQFIATDKPAWLQDYNGDMEKIDAGINAAKVAADTAQNTANSAVSSIGTVTSDITALQTDVSAHTTDITDLQGDVNTIESLIGNGTPTTTDHTIIGAINEINAEVGLNAYNYTESSSKTLTVVGSGFLILSASYYCHVDDYGSLNLNIRKNGTIVGVSQLRIVSGAGAENFALSTSAAIPVNNGDVIIVGISGSATQSSKELYINALTSKNVSF